MAQNGINTISNGDKIKFIQKICLKIYSENMFYFSEK